MGWVWSCGDIWCNDGQDDPGSRNFESTWVKHESISHQPKCLPKSITHLCQLSSAELFETKRLFLMWPLPSNTFSDQVSPCIIIMMLRSISDCFSFVLFFVDTVDSIWGTSLLCFVYVYKKMAQRILHRTEICVLHVIPSRKVLLLQLEPGSTSSWMEKAWSCQSQEHCIIPMDCTVFFEFNGSMSFTTWSL